MGDGWLLQSARRFTQRDRSAARFACRGTAIPSSRPMRSRAGFARVCKASSAMVGPGFVYILPPHRFCAHERIVRSGGDNFLQFAVSVQHCRRRLLRAGGGERRDRRRQRDDQGHLGQGHERRALLPGAAQRRYGVTSRRRLGDREDSTAADAKTAGWLAGTTAGASKFEIRGRGKVRLFGLSLENTTGAVVDNFGIVSVHVKSYAVADADHWATELEHRGADLIMFMIGANEAQWLHPGDHALKEYQAHYEKLLAPIRKGRPDASCLVVSPTDQAEADGTRLQIQAGDSAARRRTTQGCTCPRLCVLFDVRLDGRQRLVGEVVQEALNQQRLHPSVGAGANKMADGLFETLMNGSRACGPLASCSCCRRRLQLQRSHAQHRRGEPARAQRIDASGRRARGRHATAATRARRTRCSARHAR